MRDYERELASLREKMARLERERAEVESLRRQEEACRREAEALCRQWNKEQADVDKLGRMSFSALASALVGNRAERLEREEAEAYAARMKYQAAERQLAALRQELMDRENWVRNNQDIGRQYQDLLREKEADLRQRDPALARRLAELEDRARALAAQRRELQEALDAGQRALYALESAHGQLDSALGLGAWDIFGGGMVASMLKYDCLDKAQEAIETLRRQLSRFQAELGDVAVEASFSLDTGGFVRTVDIFFDNIIADFSVQSRIQDAMGMLNVIGRQIGSTLQYLRQEMERTEREFSALAAERDRTVAGA